MDRDTQHARAAIIRKLNDEFRRSGGNGRVMVTRGVLGVGYDFAAQCLERVSAFDDFGEDIDPWHEHDYGAFTLKGREVWWKIDYYDAAMELGSNDPANPDVTTRVLTIMLPEEY
jgi:hypothetical protein